MNKSEMVEAARIVLNGMMADVIRNETSIHVESGIKDGMDGYFVRCPICDKEQFVIFYKHEFNCCGKEFSWLKNTCSEIYSKKVGDAVYYIEGYPATRNGEVTIPNPQKMGFMDMANGLYHFWERNRDNSFTSKREIVKFPVSEYNSVYQEIREKKSEKKRKESPETLAYKAFVPTKVPEFPAVLVSRLLNSKTGETRLICSKCNKNWVVSGEQEKKCPICGCSNVTDRYWTNSFKWEEELTPLNSIALVRWDQTCNINDGTFSQERRDIIFLNAKPKDGIVFLSKEGKITRSSKATHYIPGKVNNAELVSDIKASDLKFSGLAEYITKEACDDISKILRYVVAWKNNPNIEHYVKCGLNLITERCLFSNEVETRKNTVLEALGISPLVYKITREHDLVLDIAKSLEDILKSDSSVNEETLIFFSKMSFALLSRAKNINQLHGVYFCKIQEYLTKVYNHQCISYGDAISIWNDYLQMAKLIGIDLSNKSNLYPDSLKKAHDVAMWAYNEIEEKIKERTFKAAAEKNDAKYGYDIEQEDYLIRIPKTVSEVVHEANCQHNCLRSYISRIANGSTCVVFLRKKEDPDTPYVTIEVCDNHLVQVKGIFNSNPKDKDLLEFVDRWCKKKGISR